MKNYLKNLMFFLMGILSVFLTRNCYAKDVSKEEKASFKNVLEISKIIETINLVDNVWVGDKEVSLKEHYESALRGILANLDDPYSEYLNEQEMKDLNENIDGVYSGVGMSIKKQKGEYMEVVSPFIGSPAFKANIQIGDKVTKIDDKDILENTATETSKMLRGPKGTSVKVEIVRKGLKNPLKITLIRDNIKLEKVEYRMLENDIAYISLLQFGTGIADEIEETLKKLEKEGMKKLIFDLRTNPGGSLIESVDLASLFTKEEKMVSLAGKTGADKVYNRTKKQIFEGPMVILVNKGSASASEILTGILKDYERATIIGEKTYGKGVAQSVINFKTGDGIKITTSKYSTPKNNDINKKGIEPHIYIEMETLLSSKGYANETEKAKQNRMKEIEKLLEEIHGKEKANKLIKEGDVQLKAAIDFLNGKEVKSNKKEEK